MNDPSRPTAAGMYDYYLGGAAHTRADRAAAEQVMLVLPEISDTAWANRGFLQRAVRRMAAEWGIRQFLDIGSGLPTQRNTHDVVAEVIPDGRVVYVDSDPVAVARGRELLAEVDGASVVEADVRMPEVILDHPETRRLIDFSEPVGLLLIAVLHFVPDTDEPYQVVERYLQAFPSGSYLALSHGSADHAQPRVRDAIVKIYAATPSPPTERTRTEIEHFFDGLEIVPPFPGARPELSFAGVWGADDPDAADSEGGRLVYAAVARKP